jgi:Zn-dependent membrane protease YugP
MGMDLSYFLYVGPGMLISFLATVLVKATFAKYAKVPTSGQRSGAEIAQQLLHASGVNDVTVERVDGFLSDHYDPSAKALRLSPDVYDGRTISAAGVAAHEAGHAIQHQVGYGLMGVRQVLVAPARFGTSLSYFVIVGGMLLHLTGLAWLGVILFSAVFLFELVTVPVEINASARAKQHLLRLGIITPQEAGGVSAVLSAAAFTYIAAMITTLLTLLYYIMLLRRRR